MKKYSTALLVGRFQPPHNGHLFLINKALKIADKLIIVIGSANVSQTEDNPWSYQERLEMLEKVIKNEKITKQILKIIPSNDVPEDEKWQEELLKNTGKFEIVVSNNDWVNDILGKAGYPIYRTGLFNREELEGVKIRKLIKQNQPWQNRVPPCLLPLLVTNSFNR